LAAVAGLPNCVLIRPWREPIKGLAKNHRFVPQFFGRVHGTDHFLGAGFRHRGSSYKFSKNTALILMGDWCGSKKFSATETDEKFGGEIETLSESGSVPSSKKSIKILLWRGVF
jgi:hypothetical protein